MQIQDEGAKYISRVMSQSKVTSTSLVLRALTQSSSVRATLLIQYPFTIQTLTDIYLQDNSIGNQGAKYILDALSKNKVSIIFYRQR